MRATSLEQSEEAFANILAALQVHRAAGNLSALGTCIFAGAFSFGMEEAGFRVAGHLELPNLALGSETSRQRWPVAVAPLERWQSFVQELRTCGAVPDVVYANPPCVAYAGTGKHSGTLDDRMCFTRYCAYEAALGLEPDAWVWELVPGVMQDRGFLDAMAFRAKKHGYRCYAFLTSAALHGGFQDRRRFHFVASKYELDFEGVYAREPEERRRVYTLGDALEMVNRASHSMDLDNHENVYNGAFRAIFPFCPPGRHLRDVPENLMREHYRPKGREWDGAGLPGFSHTRARWDRPSPNVLGGHTIVHPVEDRYLTPRECATVMGFPLDYKFSGGTKAYAEIGRGLCTHNAAFVGRVLNDALSRRVRTVPTRIDDSWMTVVDWRRRAKVSTVKMTKAEEEAWWAARHGAAAADG